MPELPGTNWEFAIMMIECVISPTPETEKRLFTRPWALMNFRDGIKRAISAVKKDVIDNAPRASGDFINSIVYSISETGDPFRVICRVQSFSDYADIIEFGAVPHVVPTRNIMRWMQKVGMNLRKGTDPAQVAFSIQRKIAQGGLQPKLVFTQAYSNADQHFHSYLDPILSAIDGSATFDIELKSSGSYVLPIE